MNFSSKIEASTKGKILITGTDNCTCGVSKKKTGGQDYISGGIEVDPPHVFPWVVRITGGCAGI